MIKTLLLLPLLIASCATIIADKPNGVKNYYTRILQGELGCMENDIQIIGNLETTGLCGSADSFKVKCKSKTYICTITSSIISSGVTIAGITQTKSCRPQTKCKEEAM